MKDIVTLSVVNFAPDWGNKAGNRSRIIGYIEAAARSGSDMVVFPEMALTGYDDEPEVPKEKKMQTLNAEAVPGPASEALAEVTKKYGIYAIVGMPIRDNNDPVIVYNGTVICGPDGIVGCYHKIHLALNEPHWATRGQNLPFIFDTPFGKVQSAVCYDSYSFPEMYRYARAKGARLFLNSTACATDGVRSIFQKVLERQCSMNVICVASANLVGKDLTNSFFGGSQILVPAATRGKVDLAAGHTFDSGEGLSPGMYTATIDLSAAANAGRLPLFERNPKVGAPDWRPEIYLKMYEAVLADGSWQGKTTGVVTG